MKILVISTNYPSVKHPSNGIFVYKLVQKFVDKGHEVTVISPVKFWDKFFKGSSYGLEKAWVIRPWIISFSAQNILGFNTYKLTQWAQIKAVQRAVKKHNVQFELVYGHFLRNVFIGIDSLEQYQKPFFVAVGEYAGIDMTLAWLGRKKFMGYLSKIKGFIAVSEQVKTKLLTLGVPEQKIIVAPNATDLSLFKKADKNACRLKHGIPLDKFVVLFTGNFIESKGPHRLLKAIEGLENVVAMFLGSGPLKLNSPQIVFKDRVSASLMPELYNCADTFVLPTQHEGSNNSIVEAMACGLPIISSDIPEVRSQCDPSFSILVNPMDIQAIREAIIRLRDDKSMRISMSENAVQWANKFDLNRRTERILAFIRDQLK